MLHIYLPFLNDVVKGPTLTYNNEEIKLGLRRYVVKHI